MMQIPRRPIYPVPTPPQADLQFIREDSDGGLVYVLRVDDPEHLPGVMCGMFIVFEGALVHAQPVKAAPITVEIPSLHLKDGAA